MTNFTEQRFGADQKNHQQTNDAARVLATGYRTSINLNRISVISQIYWHVICSKRNRTFQCLDIKSYSNLKTLNLRWLPNDPLRLLTLADSKAYMMPCNTDVHRNDNGNSRQLSAILTFPTRENLRWVAVGHTAQSTSFVCQMPDDGCARVSASDFKPVTLTSFE